MFYVNEITMFLQDCRMDGGMQASVAKTDVETFSDLLAAIRRVKKNRCQAG